MGDLWSLPTRKLLLSTLRILRQMVTATYVGLSGEARKDERQNASRSGGA